MTVNRGLPVNLPKAASSQRDLRESVNITVTREGDIFLNKEPEFSVSRFQIGTMRVFD